MVAAPAAPVQAPVEPPPPPALTYISTLVGGTQGMAFGTVVQGATNQKSWTFRNDGTAALTLTPSGITAPFSVVSNTCAAVATGGTCAVTVALSTLTTQADVTRTVTFTQGPNTLTGYSVQGAVMASGITVTNASYGANWGLSNNRTTYVAGLCNGTTSCTIPAGSLYSAAQGGDPAPGKSKNLTVEYACSGIPHATYARNPEAGTASNTLTCP